MPPPVSPPGETGANDGTAFGAGNIQGNIGVLIGGIVGGVGGALMMICCCVAGFCALRARRASRQPKESTYSSGVGPWPASLPSGIDATSSAHHVISLDIDHDHSMQPGAPGGGAPPPPPGVPPPPPMSPEKI